MATIHKKIWPKWFNLIKKGKKNVEFRLADFKLKEGDTLVLKNGIQRGKNIQEGF